MHRLARPQKAVEYIALTLLLWLVSPTFFYYLGLGGHSDAKLETQGPSTPHAGSRAIRRTPLVCNSSSMKIEAITLREIQMPLVHFFETSFGRVYSRRILLITVHCEGINGWAECVAPEDPFYSSEWIES